MSKTKEKAETIVAWKIKIEVEWNNGEVEEMDFPEYLTQYVDDYLTQLEEEKAEDNEDE